VAKPSARRQRPARNANTLGRLTGIDRRLWPFDGAAASRAFGDCKAANLRYVADVGLGGADKGKGGKYLILPPDYKGDVPKGYYVERSTTYGVWVALRGFVVDGKTETSAANLRTMKIYPLSRKDDPPAMDFVNATGKRVNTLMTEDYGYFEELAKLVNEEYEKSITVSTSKMSSLDHLISLIYVLVFHFTSSISLGRQVLSIQDLSGRAP
jgi:hypothetical protein